MEKESAEDERGGQRRRGCVYEKVRRLNGMKTVRVRQEDALWERLIGFAENCSWIAGKHLAGMMREKRFEEWEAVFAAVEDGEIVGYCTFLKEDYYPENRYWPWISSVFVDEKFRGRRISALMIEETIRYARECGFERVYIPSDMTGFYEKYGFRKIDELTNYGGDVDSVYMKEI